MVRATGELASVAFESGAHASRRRRRCSVETGGSTGAAGPESPRVLSHGGSTLESRVGEVEEGRNTVAPARVPWARPWRGAVRAASDAAGSCEALRSCFAIAFRPQESHPHAVTQRPRCSVRQDWPCALPGYRSSRSGRPSCEPRKITKISPSSCHIAAQRSTRATVLHT